MTKRDLAADGLSIVLPDEPNFAGELKAIGFSSPSTPKDVIVKNSQGATSPLSAFAMSIGSRTVALPRFSTLSRSRPVGCWAPGKRVSQPLIEGGGALLLSPGGDGIVRHTPSQIQAIGRVYPDKKVVGAPVCVRS